MAVEMSPRMRRRATSADMFPGYDGGLNVGDSYEVPLSDSLGLGGGSNSSLRQPIRYGSDHSMSDSSASLDVSQSPTRSTRGHVRKSSDDESFTTTLPPLAPISNPQSPSQGEALLRSLPQHLPLSHSSSDHSLDSLSLSHHGSRHSLDCWSNAASATNPIVYTARTRKSTLSFAVMAFSMLGFALYSNARSSLRFAVKEVNDLVVFSEKLHRQLGRADRDMRMLERELAALDAIEQKREDDEVEERVLSQSSAFANPKLVEEMSNLQRKLRYSQTKADKLKTQVIDISRRDAVAKYGKGVIRVQMELIFPGDDEYDDNSIDTNSNENHELDRTPTRGGTKAGAAAAAAAAQNQPHTIVLEMASLDLMPHSVYTFLEMVSNELLNGCSFILNALHVLKAAPLPYDGTSASEKAREFLDHGLESVAFREYAPDYPHVQYTVGFSADGSPSFYINTEDNTEIHVGDPCFAKIVSGFETIQRMVKMPTRNGIWLEHRIGIKRVTIL